MVLNGIGASTTRRSPALSHSADDQAPASEQHALVPVQEIEAAARPTPFSRRPAAPFLAHLIATERGEPQTRAHRRAEPQAAAQAYAAVAERVYGVNFRKS